MNINFKALAFGTAIFLVSGWFAKYMFTSMLEYLGLLKQVKEDGKFVYSKRGSGTAQIRLVKDALPDEEKKICSSDDHKGLVFFDKLIKLFAYFLGIAISGGLCIGMIFWIMKVAFK